MRFKEGQEKKTIIKILDENGYTLTELLNDANTLAKDDIVYSRKI